MSSDVAIKVEHLSKLYSLRKTIANNHGGDTHDLWALKDVSFEIKQGESVGIIGHNGSGKSTLLKILAGVTKPTSGRVEINGRIASILDIGAGFHPELSGRENIFLNGQIQGFGYKAIEAKLDEIVAFSGIETFIHEPVKNYSNGMYLRLAFSIMAHLDFDVYLFDEVMSVGDAEFSIKTKNKYQELLHSNKTIVFVSHNLQELQGRDRYLLFNNGILTEPHQEENVLSEYLENSLRQNNIEIYTREITITDFSRFSMSKDIKVLSIRLFQEENPDTFITSKPFHLEIIYEKIRDDNTTEVLMNISDLHGNTLLTSSPFINGTGDKNMSSGKYKYKCTMQSPIFNSQIYSISIFIFNNMLNLADKLKEKPIGVKEVSDKSIIELTLQLDRIITFKPILQTGGMEFMQDVVINKQAGLLPDFKWEITSENV